MGLRQKVDQSLKQAMRDRDAQRLSTLRLINAAIKDREIAKRAEDGEPVAMDDVEVRGILAKMVKQRRESAKAYEEAGRLGLAEQELGEILILEEFLPKQLNEQERATAISQAMNEVGADSIRDVGRVMARLKEKHAGSMDFAVAGAEVRARLSA